MSNKNLMFQSRIKSFHYPASQILTNLVKLCAQKSKLGALQVILLSGYCYTVLFKPKSIF